MSESTPARLPAADFDVALFPYQGANRIPSRCRIRIYVQADRSIVVATWDSNSEGMSITNAAEVIATKVAREYGLEAFVWIEHYDAARPTFDLVAFEGDVESGFRNPTWSPLGAERALELIEEVGDV